ncbi:YbaN family protein [Methylonatrum kenyense]|uniref:YbaN family protein n=1 Tax=Methylonatrum kenyense TaxID=455253 RepID=UPI0020BFB209|nr:YbaN family protein [Methylonatrum kenyense]MCK8515869.1 YbaN family protein [Methylonatrum kenyense]
MGDPLTRYCWRFFGTACVGVGAVGVLVPLLPTTPFLLLAAWAYARGSERWRLWLVNHPRLGPCIRAWQQSRAIPRRAKGVAMLSLLSSVVIAVWLALPPLVLGAQAAALLAVSAFILTRPTAS